MNNDILKYFEEFIIVFFHPKENGEEFIHQLLENDLNRIGNYKNCISWSEVTSTWTPLNGAHPYIGEVDQTCVEQEIRIEMRCKTEHLQDVVRAIKSSHPYEEIEIDIIPFWRPDQIR